MLMCAQSQWLRIMPLTAYVDDSGSDLPSPIYVLGGVVLPEPWWKQASGDWSGVLRSHPTIEYFKASEVWDRQKGQFAFID
jgi:hypothetical protein